MHKEHAIVISRRIPAGFDQPAERKKGLGHPSRNALLTQSDGTAVTAGNLELNVPLR